MHEHFRQLINYYALCAKMSNCQRLANPVSSIFSS